jgi:1-piperideine-2-carboxylate/1-pyrroline-2-carboxylate reductase [NAD(P)H]
MRRTRNPVYGFYRTEGSNPSLSASALGLEAMSAGPPATLLLDAAATQQRLPFAPLVQALADAALQLQAGEIVCPPRTVLPLRAGHEGALLLSMPAVAADLVAHKLITVTPANAARGLPTIQGQVSVIDPSDGALRLVLDGPTVTGRRTAAVSMLGLRVLWPQGPRRVLLVGTGAQARHHADALAALFPGVPVGVRGSSLAAAATFCAAMQGRHLLLRPAQDPIDGEDFDVLITCTTSRTPVYREPARAARLLIATGAFQPDAAEIAADTVRASTVVVDDPTGAAHEAGDILLAGVAWSAVLPLAVAIRAGAPTDARPLMLKSVGCAAWDLAAARVALAQGDPATPRNA